MSFQTPRRTFIVDDNADYHKPFKTVFEEVRPANRLESFLSGQALLERLLDVGKPLPGLILLDLLMPKMNGITTLSLIRQNASLARIPTIIMTASSSGNDLSYSYQAGANAFTAKPSTFSELQHFIEVTCRYWLDVAQVPTCIQ
ncbi:response regulator [Larkinella insperata]|uniref:Response regulator n=1 Tax=Larkinella insperata TaxID=332158 RepID=A0ABW3Q0X6_9BACT|nr:response regulator [Larkinella insperata]